jgi:hypothetical protein
MPKYFLLEPEVAGELGPETIMDSSVHPPAVAVLHYELSGWLGDDLLESFPCFIVTDRCRRALETGGVSGCAFAPAKVTVSETFSELYPGRALPDFIWMKVNGRAEEDDFGLSSDYRLVISDRALRILEELQISHCDVENIG